MISLPKHSRCVGGPLDGQVVETTRGGAAFTVDVPPTGFYVWWRSPLGVMCRLWQDEPSQSD